MGLWARGPTPPYGSPVLPPWVGPHSEIMYCFPSIHDDVAWQVTWAPAKGVLRAL